MDERRPRAEWRILDKDLRKQTFLERAALHATRPLVALGLALAFLGLSAVLGAQIAGYDAEAAVLVAATVFAGYMALNIGANDVGNNMGPVVGSGAVPLGVALVIAAICEVAGAVLAGSHVVDTIAFGILRPEQEADSAAYIRVMLAGLIAAGIWINIATLLSATISTTHSIVGGITGATLMAFGSSAVNWPSLLMITFSWVISPLAGGGLAALLLALIHRLVTDAPEPGTAALDWVPVMIGTMAGAFAALMLSTTLQGLFHLPPAGILFASLAAAVVVGLACQPAVRRQAELGPKPEKAVRAMFSLPLVLAAALSFAHGASDVSNAIGPLIAILAAGNVTDAVSPGTTTAAIALGGVGIALGLLLFGPRLIRVVGKEITKLNPIRAYCVLLSAATVTTCAALLGLPVSSTHIALGGIFGIGFWREWREARLVAQAGTTQHAAPPPEEAQRRKLVRRSLVFTMLGAWIITLPVSGGLAALVFLILHSG